MRYIISLLVIFNILICVPGQLKAEEQQLSAKAQAFINKGLDAIKIKKWDEAIKNLKEAIETSTVEDCPDLYCDEMVKTFKGKLPPYVFYNLALAADKQGRQPLSTAIYYQAYLAYESESEKRKEIEKRIKELEEEHLQYIYPLCESAAARMSMVSYINNGPTIPANCIMALTTIKQKVQAKKIEDKFKKGFFTKFSKHCNTGNTDYIDVGYAMGYGLLGDDKAFAKYRKFIQASTHYKQNMCKDYTSTPIYTVKYLDKFMEEIAESRKSWKWKLNNQKPQKDTAVKVLDWVNLTHWVDYADTKQNLCITMGQFSQNPITSPLINLEAYLKQKNYDPYNSKDISNNAEANFYSEVIAGHNTCAASLMARYWLEYDLTKQLWK